MNSNEGRILKILAGLTSTHKRNFAILLILPIALIALKGEIDRVIMGFATKRDAPRKVDAVRTQIDSRTKIYDQLKTVIVNYEQKDILAGISDELLTKYFTTFIFNPPPPPAPPKVAVAVVQAPKPKPAPKPVIKPSEQLVSFIYFRGEEDGTRSFVILNDDLMRQGDTNKKGVTVRTIEHNRVLLTNKWSSEWVTLNY